LSAQQVLSFILMRIFRIEEDIVAQKSREDEAVGEL
jgi:hypothetical protein